MKSIQFVKPTDYISTNKIYVIVYLVFPVTSLAFCMHFGDIIMIIYLAVMEQDVTDRHIPSYIKFTCLLAIQY